MKHSRTLPATAPALTITPHREQSQSEAESAQVDIMSGGNEEIQVFVENMGWLEEKKNKVWQGLKTPQCVG